jgi:hypothetical protein
MLPCVVREESISEEIRGRLRSEALARIVPVVIGASKEERLRIVGLQHGEEIHKGYPVHTTDRLHRAREVLGSVTLILRELPVIQRVTGREITRRWLDDHEELDLATACELVRFAQDCSHERDLQFRGLPLGEDCKIQVVVVAAGAGLLARLIGPVLFLARVEELGEKLFREGFRSSFGLPPVPRVRIFQGVHRTLDCSPWKVTDEEWGHALTKTLQE